MKINQPGAHLDQLLRQTRAHHVQLSSMADLKANMLITLSALIITFTAPHTISPALRWPGVVLIVSCLLTLTLAIYAVMPRISGSGHAAKPQERGPMFNLLFFGDFAHLPYEEFEGAMENILNDPSQVYEAQVREVYALGTFLAHKKYRFLRLAYLTFLIGLLASAAVFAITSLG